MWTEASDFAATAKDVVEDGLPADHKTGDQLLRELKDSQTD